MPTHYTIDRVLHVVLCKAEGRVTDDDARAHQEKLRKDPSFDPTCDLIWDVTGTTEIALTAAGISDMITTQPFAPGIRRAVIVATPIQYGMTRMVSNMAGTRDDLFRIFSTRAEALAWLAEPQPGVPGG